MVIFGQDGYKWIFHRIFSWHMECQMDNLWDFSEFADALSMNLESRSFRDCSHMVGKSGWWFQRLLATLDHESCLHFGGFKLPALQGVIDGYRSLFTFGKHVEWQLRFRSRTPTRKECREVFPRLFSKSQVISCYFCHITVETWLSGTSADRLI